MIGDHASVLRGHSGTLAQPTALGDPTRRDHSRAAVPLEKRGKLIAADVFSRWIFRHRLESFEQLSSERIV